MRLISLNGLSISFLVSFKIKLLFKKVEAKQHMTKYCIYSLEDDDDIAKIIKLALSKQDYDVSTFSNGHDFLKAFQE